MNNDSSGVNTILIVLLLVIAVGGIAWFVTARSGGQKTDGTKGINVDVNLPAGGDQGSGSDTTN